MNCRSIISRITLISRLFKNMYNIFNDSYLGVVSFFGVKLCKEKQGQKLSKI